MKKLISALILAGLFAAPAIQAQTNADKNALAARVVAVQQGPELDRLVDQLTQSSVQDLINNWGPKITALPKAQQGKATEDLNAELKTFAEDARTAITGQLDKVNTSVMVPAYAEKFSAEELQQLAAFFESAAVKKYQAAAPDLGTIFVQKLIEAARPDVAARAEKFNASAQKIVGSTPAPSTPKSPAKK